MADPSVGAGESTFAGRGGGASRGPCVARPGRSATSHEGEAGEQCDQRAVGPGRTQTADVAAKHRQLLTEDKDLGTLGDAVHPVRTDELEHAADELI